MSNLVENPTRLPIADDLSRLLNRIVAACRGEGAEGSLISVPSERELSSQLQMSRHSVRNALAHLQRQGLLCRPSGRGPLLLSAAVPAARSNVAGELRCINLILNSGLDRQGLHWLRDEYLAGYTEVLEHEACKVRYVAWRPEVDDLQSLLWCHASPQQQGCLVVGRDPVLLKRLAEQGVPYVVQNYCLYDYQALSPHHKVFVNKAGAAFKTTRRLLELGHRRIGFAGSTPIPDRSWPEYDGYQAAMRFAGLIPTADDVLELSTQAVQETLDSCRRLLDRPQRPSAVLAGNGAITIGLSKTAESLGISVPQELSIVGFDDEKTPMYPALSTIAVPRRALSRQAVELLLQVSRNRDLPPQTRVLDCVLNDRTTMGPWSGE